MKLPSRDFVLAGGLLCPSATLEPKAWQAHVVKHPLGIEEVARLQRLDAWSGEAWDKLTPPVVTEDERAATVRAIRAIAEHGRGCEVPEFRGTPGTFSSRERVACYDCSRDVLNRCVEILGASGGVGARYAKVTEELLAAVADGEGVSIAWPRFLHVLHKLFRTPEKLDGLVVLTVGLDDRRAAKPIARISRDDGVRAEFFLEEPNRLRWRTTHRSLHKVQAVGPRISFIGDNARPAPGLGPVSEICLVGRRWWEAHGI